MTGRTLMVLMAMGSSSLVWGADTREDLGKARTNYQQAVAAHGAKSAEARAARRQLRTARATYHADRRAHLHNHHPSR